MNINLYLIRHAESELNKDKLRVIVDPNITERGVRQCLELKHFLKKTFQTFQDWKLYTSILCRTQETALLSIPRKNILVSNHLKEHQNIIQKMNIKKYSNFPYKNIKQQQENIKNVVGSISLNRIHYEDGIINKKEEYDDKFYHQEGNIETFLKTNKHTMKNGDTIIIFCHGKLIRQFLKRTEKAKNCTCFYVKNNKNGFDLNQLEQKPECEILFEPIG